MKFSERVDVQKVLGLLNPSSFDSSVYNDCNAILTRQREGIEIPACLIVFPSLDALQPSRSSVAQAARSSIDVIPCSPKATSIWPVILGVITSTNICFSLQLIWSAAGDIVSDLAMFACWPALPVTRVSQNLDA